MGENFATYPYIIQNVLSSEDKKKIAYYLEAIAHNCKKVRLWGKFCFCMVYTKL